MHACLATGDGQGADHIDRQDGRLHGLPERGIEGNGNRDGEVFGDEHPHPRQERRIREWRRRTLDVACRKHTGENKKNIYYNSPYGLCLSLTSVCGAYFWSLQLEFWADRFAKGLKMFHLTYFLYYKVLAL